MKSFFKKNSHIILLVILVLCAALGFGLKTYLSHPAKKAVEKKEVKKEEEKVIPKLKIIDQSSTNRPVGVMIDNVKAAWPQAGISDAYLTYEIVVEGGLTRLFALFKDVDTSMIGPVRSLRHYYIDYQMENDSILTHFGHSPRALSDINSLKVPSINGIFVSSVFWRDSSITVSPHNAFTSMEKIRSYAKTKKLDKEVNTTLLNYSIENIDNNTKEGAVVANTVNIKYSYAAIINYQYDVLTKSYFKMTNNVPTKDRNTNERLSVKNIIVIGVKNQNLADTETKGRQELLNIGTGDGYYITNGYAVPIKYQKTSRASKTKYTYLNGEEIKVNDGNTYIQIQPLGEALTIE